jgi:hypothetical protein
MKLSELTSEPKLIEIIVDDEDIVKEYGDSLTFYTWDRQPIETFFRITEAGQDNQSEMVNIMKTLILDEKGEPIMSGKTMLPVNVLMKSITKVTEMLGKSQTPQ